MAEPLAHQLTMTVLMTPDMANFSGNVHGGTVLKLLDQVAYACASRYAGRYVVTLSVDQVTFRQPIHVGELVGQGFGHERLPLETQSACVGTRWANAHINS